MVQHLHVLVEGQTEEIVAQEIILPYFSTADVRVTWSIYKTKRPAAGPAHKGGLSHWPKLYQELRLLLRDSSITLLTTIFDYYAFPIDAPGMADRPQGSPYDRVQHVENAIAEAIADRRFLPKMVQQELGPELVDDGWATSPSKRILNAYPRYRKTIDGPLVIADAGLDSMRRSCPHSDDWLENVEARLLD